MHRPYPIHNSCTNRIPSSLHTLVTAYPRHRIELPSSPHTLVTAAITAVAITAVAITAVAITAVRGHLFAYTQMRLLLLPDTSYIYCR
jgi:hypothetical protein